LIRRETSLDPGRLAALMSVKRARAATDRRLVGVGPDWRKPAKRRTIAHEIAASDQRRPSRLAFGPPSARRWDVRQDERQ